MRRLKASLLLATIVVSSFLLMATTPVAMADQGDAKVYIICLSDVDGWSMGQTVNIQKVRDGVIRALSPKESIHIPLVHPKYGKAPPFYGMSYEVVTDWTTYKEIIESYEGVIVVNTHGEITPIPNGYSRGD